MFNYTYEEKDFQLAERFCAVVAGTDQFFRALPLEAGEDKSFTSEGLVPVDFTGVAPAKISSWQEAIDALNEIARSYASLKNPVRRNYMCQQVSSFRRVCRWMSGEPSSYREIVRETMYLDENPVPEKRMARYYQTLDQLLSQEGYKGSLKEKLDAWHEDRVIRDPEQVVDTLNRLLAEAQEKTVALGFPIAGEQQVKARLEYDVAYSAYCDFMTRSIYVSGDVAFTEEELRHLVCHEAYPGHMTHMARREELLKLGRVPADAGLVITNTASSPIFEGLADNGQTVLGWDTSVHDRIAQAYNAVLSIAGVNASHMLHGEGASEAQVSEYLHQAAFSNDTRAAARIRFMKYPVRRPFLYSYWRGWEAVGQVWASLSLEQQGPFLTYLYDNMHSIDTMKQFCDYAD